MAAPAAARAAASAGGGGEGDGIVYRQVRRGACMEARMVESAAGGVRRPNSYPFSRTLISNPNLSFSTRPRPTSRSPCRSSTPSCRSRTASSPTATFCATGPRSACSRSTRQKKPGRAKRRRPRRPCAAAGAGTRWPRRRARALASSWARWTTTEARAGRGRREGGGARARPAARRPAGRPLSRPSHPPFSTGMMRGYIAMLVVSDAYRGRGVGEGGGKCCEGVRKRIR
jgi:hypothetical protein